MSTISEALNRIADEMHTANVIAAASFSVPESKVRLGSEYRRPLVAEFVERLEIGG